MSKYCPGCGAENKESAIFCVMCGAKLDGSQPAQTQLNQTEPQSKPKTGLTIAVIIGVIVLFFVLLGSFMIFILPDLIANPSYYTHPAESHPEGYYTHADYSNTDRSSIPYGDENVMKDFSYTDGWKTMTDSAKRMTDFGSTVGFWKAVMITDPESASESGTSYDYFNVEVYGLPDDANVIFNWNRRVYESSGKEEDLKGGGTNYSGTFKNGALKAENTNVVELTDFFSDGDKEYAVGKFKWSNGDVGYIGLVRQKTE